MKITKKNLKENLRLVEADEINLSDSTEEVAADIQDAAEVADVELSDKEAKDTAELSKEVGDKINADKMAIIPTEEAPIEADNKLTRVLDLALKTAKFFRKEHINERANVLVSGLPGSSKTASVYNWAKGKVNVAYLNAKDKDLNAAINGYPTLDPNTKKDVIKAVSHLLDDLERPNSVLFVDELNRQTKADIRGSLLSLINEHYVTGNEAGGRHYFKNFLFTIAAINPGGTHEDAGAAKLTDAEKSRYLYTVSDFDSDKEVSSNYITKKFGGLAKRLAKMTDVAAEDVWEDELEKLQKNMPAIIDMSEEDLSQLERIEIMLRIEDLSNFILTHDLFKYDNKSVIDQLYDQDKTLLCQRTLTAGLAASRGDVDAFRTWVDNYSNFLQRDINMLDELLDQYQNFIPSLEELLAKEGITEIGGKPIKAWIKDAEGGQTDKAAEEENDFDDLDLGQEDDMDIFGQQTNGSSSKTIRDPAEVADVFNSMAF